MVKNKRVTAIILAGGTGARFGSSTNKVYEGLNGKPIIKYSLEVFSKSNLIDEIILVIKSGEERLFEQNLLEYEDSVKIVYGGNSRQESVKNALEQCNSDIAIIHDGARPFVTETMIINCINSMSEFSGVTVGVKSKDTIKITDDSGVVINTTIRKNTWIIQTPQCFNVKLLKEAHFSKLPDDVEITDDCMLMEYFGHKVKMVEGAYSNIKITLKEDLDIANFLLQNNM